MTIILLIIILLKTLFFCNINLETPLIKILVYKYAIHYIFHTLEYCGYPFPIKDLNELQIRIKKFTKKAPNKVGSFLKHRSSYEPTINVLRIVVNDVLF